MTDDRIENLLRGPTESLQVELKTWLDPQTDEDAAKLVKAIFAIRNRNGGFVVIGFDNGTLQPDPCPFPDIGALYHVDVIQGLVSRYANTSFEVEVVLRELDGQRHPVLVVPEGFRSPVVVKRDLRVQGAANLLSEGDLYFRTLRSNGTPSSARIRPSANFSPGAPLPSACDACSPSPITMILIQRFLGRSTRC